MSQLKVVIEGVGSTVVVVSEHSSDHVRKALIKKAVKDACIHITDHTSHRVMIRDEKNRESFCRVLVGNNNVAIDIY